MSDHEGGLPPSRYRSVRLPPDYIAVRLPYGHGVFRWPPGYGIVLSPCGYDVVRLPFDFGDEISPAFRAYLDTLDGDARLVAVEMHRGRRWDNAWRKFGQSLSQALKAKKPRGMRPLHRAVDVIKAETFDDLLKALGNEELIEDLYGSRENPIDIHVVEIDEEAQKMEFSVRGKPEPHKVGFKYLKEIFRKIQISMPD